MKSIGKNIQGNEQFTFEATLLRVGTATLQNANAKNYKLVDVEFADVNGEVQKATAAVYEGNYSHGIEVGKKYLTTATIVGDQVYLQMSHLETSAGRAAVSMFLAGVKSEAPVGSLAS